MAFQPAMEMPRNENCTWSQRTSGAFSNAASGSPPPALAGLLHVVKPSHQWYSIPAWNAPIAPEVRIASAASATHTLRGGTTNDSSASASAPKWA